MSFNAASLDTKFGKARDFKEKIKSITKKEIIIQVEILGFFLNPHPNIYFSLTFWT